jgi:hypothetical protein
MLRDVLGSILFLLNPGPAPEPQPAPPGALTPEQAVAYETAYNNCAGSYDPDQCREDLYDRYYN